MLLNEEKLRESSWVEMDFEQQSAFAGKCPSTIFCSLFSFQFFIINFIYKRIHFGIHRKNSLESHSVVTVTFQDSLLTSVKNFKEDVLQSAFLYASFSVKRIYKLLLNEGLRENLHH